MYCTYLRAYVRMNWAFTKYVDQLLVYDLSIKGDSFEQAYEKNIFNTNNIFGGSGLSIWKYEFSYDHWSQAMLSSLSTWMGVLLSTRGHI